MAKTLVLASNNQGKIQEFAELLPNWQIKPQAEFFAGEAVEDGLSFIENAILKARFAAAKTGLPAIADDSGLEVAALSGAPGIYSARYAGEPKSDARNIEALLASMADFTAEQRRANFYCAIAFMRHAEDPTPIIGLGKWQGEILTEARGDNGFGYDPVFYLPELNCTAAELTAEQKNQLSHRAQALRALVGQM